MSDYRVELADELPLELRLRGLTLVLACCLLVGCAARKPAIKPGHDAAHPALTPVGKVVCKTGVLKLFNSYGWRNCKNGVTGGAASWQW